MSKKKVFFLYFIQKMKITNVYRFFSVHIHLFFQPECVTEIYLKANFDILRKRQ